MRMKTNNNKERLEMAEEKSYVWVHTSPEEITRFKKKNNIPSEIQLAKVLRVSLNGLRFWLKKGKVARPSKQAHLAKMMADYVKAPCLPPLERVRVKRLMVVNDPPPVSEPNPLTGLIIEYLEGGGVVSGSSLPEMIRDVRGALGV